MHTNLDFYGIMHNPLIYFYSGGVVCEPSSAGIWGEGEGFRWLQILHVRIDAFILLLQK